MKCCISGRARRDEKCIEPDGVDGLSPQWRFTGRFSTHCLYVAFYRLLELDFTDPFEWPPGSGAEHIDDIYAVDAYMAFDNPPMARIWNRQFEPERSRGNVVIGLMVPTREDVDRLYEKVKAAGHQVGQEPYDAFFGSRYAIVIDSDGNQVGLKSPIENERRYEPDFDDL